MKIFVKTNDGGYDIILGSSVLKDAGKYIDLDRKVLIVTDDGVPKDYSDIIALQCAQSLKVTLPEGEKTKSFSSLQTILSNMLDFSMTRGDCVVAVGGGVVGDISGFAASCYMRGIDFYNIPTTLLSQVDSSIGGKTAIDFKGAKNIVGAFYQPKAVLIDPQTLSTLDDNQFSAGLCEAIKMAATCDADLFSYIKNSTDIRKDAQQVIYSSLMIKKQVVENDPKESGLRKVLNFGHTIGHAIESCYDAKLLHGECVALGMLPMCSSGVRDELITVLKKYDLPTKVYLDFNELRSFLKHDKKSQADIIKTVYVNEIGSFEFRDMKVDELVKAAEVLV